MRKWQLVLDTSSVWCKRAPGGPGQPALTPRGRGWEWQLEPKRGSFHKDHFFRKKIVSTVYSIHRACVVHISDSREPLSAKTYYCRMARHSGLFLKFPTCMTGTAKSHHINYFTPWMHYINYRSMPYTCQLINGRGQGRRGGSHFASSCRLP